MPFLFCSFLMTTDIQTMALSKFIQTWISENCLNIYQEGCRVARLSLGLLEFAFINTFNPWHNFKLTLQAPELHVLQRCEPVGSFLSTPSAWLHHTEKHINILICQRGHITPSTLKSNHMVINTAYVWMCVCLLASAGRRWSESQVKKVWWSCADRFMS